jgi:CRP-like cAMP-binding protein
LSRAGIAE